MSQLAFEPNVAIVIPTYNRAIMLRDTLTALVLQTYPRQRLEVVVVDDGSTDETEEVAHESFPFEVCYVRQENSGDALARNTGAQHTEADLLVFLDDDIVVTPDFLHHIVADHGGCEKRIIAGTLINGSEQQEQLPSRADQGLAPLDFVDLCSNNMAICRDDYLALGGMDNLGFSGSSIWCDVDFSFRAYNQQYEFVRSRGARYWHRNYVDESLSNQIRRFREAGFRAATLFQKHPSLSPYLPMFTDKTAIRWRTDSLALVARKLARPVTSSRPVLAALERTALTLESRYVTHRFLPPLRRWIIGGNIYQGYRRGLREARQTA